ncbi:hypothetical protein CSQ96_26415 [Janthinobacterium sp. BJB412]|nr:hypothetical protein CSQ96_26415 [Janthinobacterium sp. BJB412]
MTSPLSLMMPCLPGTSLIAIAATLAEAQKEIDTALEDIGTVHFSRILMLDRSQANLQPQLDKAGTSDSLIIGVITEYDGDFNAYIGDFAAQLGNVFDSLLKFVVGGAALIPVKNNVAALQAYIAVNDASQHIPNNRFYAAYPQTVQQILAAV